MLFLLDMLTDPRPLGMVLRAGVTILFSCFWGFMTKKVIENKGYSTNWFFWGFFFGIIALIVALLRPEQRYETWDEMQQREQDEKLLAKGGWECHCGKVNPSYVQVCACGTTRSDMSSDTE